MNLDLGSFKYNQDEESPSSGCQAKAKLSWRLDPEESLSDYKIVVTTPNDANEDRPQARKRPGKKRKKKKNEGSVEFSVHKNILAVGPHSSQYFARLFLSETELTEHTSNASSIELEPSAAKVFPKMLDFIYSSKHDYVLDDITSQDAVPLRHLASYFGVEELFEEVNAFIREDLKYTNAPIYVTEAVIYNDEKILDAASVLCAQNIEDIAPDVMASLPLKCFRDALLSPDFQNERKRNSTVLSKHVAAFCRKNTEELDKKILLELTDKEAISMIDSDEAFYLMNLSRKYLLPTTSKKEPGATLHERCISALSINWSTVIVPGIKEKGCKNGYKSLPAKDKVELLEAVVINSLDPACMNCHNASCRKSDGYCLACGRYSRKCRYCKKRVLQGINGMCPDCRNYM
mmetsp:Transcript_16886/g.26362  ORF Transcript_16886/g.26362 Transcript_16886/m.26362 type:complete len:404 (-) Transcript_16886:34-1245(-)